MRVERFPHGRVVTAGPFCSASGQASSSTERRDRPSGEPGRAGQDDPSISSELDHQRLCACPNQERPSKHAPTQNAQTFADLGVPATLVAALTDAGITTPFPIQSATLPDSLAGRDVLGRGRTGSGKTYAFVLPLLARLAASPSKRLAKRPRALVLAPTRELASQIDAAMAPLARVLGLRTVTVFGGVSPSPQIRGPAQRGRHRHRLPGPARRPRAVRARRPRLGRDHRSRRGRPHGRPRLPPRGTPPARHTPRRASGCCSPPRWTAGSTCS